MPISVNLGGRAEAVLTQALNTEGVVGVALRAGVEILTDWGVRLPSQPLIVA